MTDELKDFASLMVDEVIALTRVRLERGEGLSVADQLHLLDQLIKERGRVESLRIELARTSPPRDLLDALSWIQAQASHVADNYGENSMALREALVTIADKCKAITAREEGR